MLSKRLIVMNPSPKPTGPNRLIWGILLSVSIGLMGIIAGAFLGARFLIPANAGMAGGAMVLGYGILGALIGLTAGAVLGRCLPRQWLPRSGLLCGVGGLATLIFLAIAISSSIRERQAARTQSLENLIRFEFDLNWSVDYPARPFDRFVYRSATNTMTIIGRDRETRSHRLPLETRATLLSLLREFDLSGVLREPPDCQTTGATIGELRLTIYEAKPPNTSGTLKLTEACIRSLGELQQLIDTTETLSKRPIDP